MNFCHFCGNKNFTDKKVQYTYKRDDEYIIVNAVPCEQCDFCGEDYFAATVLKTIEMEFDEIHSKGKVVKNRVTIPVEAYSEINQVVSS